MVCGEKGTMIDASINCKVRQSSCEVKSDPGKRVSE